MGSPSWGSLFPAASSVPPTLCCNFHTPKKRLKLDQASCRGRGVFIAAYLSSSQVSTSFFFLLLFLSNSIGFSICQCKGREPRERKKTANAQKKTDPWSRARNQHTDAAEHWRFRSARSARITIIYRPRGNRICKPENPLLSEAKVIDRCTGDKGKREGRERERKGEVGAQVRNEIVLTIGVPWNRNLQPKTQHHQTGLSTCVRVCVCVWVAIWLWNNRPTPFPTRNDPNKTSQKQKRQTTRQKSNFNFLSMNDKKKHTKQKRNENNT